MTNQERFEALPITVASQEQKDGWYRWIYKQGTVKDLLEVWDIDDPEEMTEIAQVLRHLRDFVALAGPVR